jgi:hypothetical protein
MLEVRERIFPFGFAQGQNGAPDFVPLLGKSRSFDYALRSG